MSGIVCPNCGAIRKIEQVWTKDGWINPECWSCKDPGWVQPLNASDPFAGRKNKENNAEQR